MHQGPWYGHKGGQSCPAMSHTQRVGALRMPACTQCTSRYGHLQSKKKKTNQNTAKRTTTNRTQEDFLLIPI